MPGSCSSSIRNSPSGPAASPRIIFLSGVEELYAEHQARGAPIILPINDNDGLRSYVVELPPGYRLRFAEGLELDRVSAWPNHEIRRVCRDGRGGALRSLLWSAQREA